MAKEKRRLTCEFCGKPGALEPSRGVFNEDDVFVPTGWAHEGCLPVATPVDDLLADISDAIAVYRSKIRIERLGRKH